MFSQKQINTSTGMNRLAIFFILSISLFSNCNQPPAEKNLASDAPVPFLWENANIYFLLTDRFNNGDQTNDLNFNRTDSTATLRGMMGGDIKGITQKLQEGYFNDLGVTAIWFTPVVEQNKGIVEEGTGPTYGYHGYWTQDWTALDPNFGTEKELEELIETAHDNGIRVILDVVINHTGPTTIADPTWPEEWVRTEPKCAFRSYATTVNCTLVDNLPDIKTETNTDVQLPTALKDKWEKESRLEKELAELEDFFERTGYPRAPRFYIIKWLTDYIRKYGVDGFRVDTAKHTEETVWRDLREEADKAFADWKRANPDKVLDDNQFYMVGEVYNYNVATDTLFDIGDRHVNYYANGLNSLINFGFKYDSKNSIDSTYSVYSDKLQTSLKGKSIVNYISSHDDSAPFDKERNQPIESATKLLLCPGATQIYYGDETSRKLIVEGASGDANLRSFMNWDEIENGSTKSGQPIKEVLTHWQKLGQFRKNHPAIGAGIHSVISESPYYFKRTFTQGDFLDEVVVGIDLPNGKKEISVKGIFEEGASLTDFYSGQSVIVKDGMVTIENENSIVLLSN